MTDKATTASINSNDSPLKSSASSTSPSPHQIDVDRNLYPHSIVFGGLPVITWLLPFIGHMGICDSSGRVHDFAGNKYIVIDDFMTGRVSRYHQLSLESLGVTAAEWDLGLAAADNTYRRLNHNLITNNCHHHSACAVREAAKLSQQQPQQQAKDFTYFSAWKLVMLHGQWSSRAAMLSTFAPLTIITTVALVLGLTL